MIVLAFWGMTRSTAFTAESIRAHIFSQVPNHVVFVHTYSSANTYENRRANERSDNIQPDYAALKPWQVEVDDMDEVKARLGLAQYHTQPDPWDTDYQTVDNFVLAMYSKERVTNMIAASGIRVDRVVFLRPDVRFLSSVRPLIAASANDAWVIPAFHLVKGFNDRFCVASRSNYKTYGCVFAYLLPYSKRRPLHSETFYAELAAAKGIRVVQMPFYFQRVRLMGETDPRDLFFHKPVHDVRGDAADPQHVQPHNRVVGDHRPVTTPAICHSFALRAADGIAFGRKPTRVVRLYVGV